MKLLKILFLGFLGLVVLLLFVISLHSMYLKFSDPKLVELELVGQYDGSGYSQYYNYVLADPNDTTPPEKIGLQLQYLCKVAQYSTCGISVWKRKAQAPWYGAPNDQEIADQYVEYIKSENPKFETFMERRDGERIPVPLPR